MREAPSRSGLGAHVRSMRTCRVKPRAGHRSAVALPGLSAALRCHAAAQLRGVDGSVEMADENASPSICASLQRQLPRQRMDAISNFATARIRAAKAERRKVSAFRCKSQ